MENKDIILTCQKCKSRFYFTIGEQKFYKKNGLNIPKYCKNCRGQRKNQSQKSNEYVPKACSTCYFRGPYLEWYVKNGEFCNEISLVDVRLGNYYKYYGHYNRCNRSNLPIVNDRPCKNWTKDY